MVYTSRGKVISLGYTFEEMDDSVKKKLMKMIESIEDEALLLNIYQFLVRQPVYPEGKLWAGLSEEQKEMVLEANAAIGDPTRWVPNEEAKRQLGL